MSVTVREVRIKRMLTRWGSCNIEASRIWLNLNLMKLDLGCLEYVVVHEMAHLLERYHNSNFYRIVEKAMPDWKKHADQLASAELTHAFF